MLLTPSFTPAQNKAANSLDLEGGRPNVDEASAVNPQIILESHVSYDA